MKGIAIACSLIAAWAVLFFHGCWQIKLTDAPDGSSRRSSWLDIVATFFLLEFVNTGLFITTHDSMHGTICFRCGTELYALCLQQQHQQELARFNGCLLILHAPAFQRWTGSCKG